MHSTKYIVPLIAPILTVGNKYRSLNTRSTTVWEIEIENI